MAAAEATTLRVRLYGLALCCMSPFLDTEQTRYLVGETAHGKQGKDVTGQGEPHAVSKRVNVSFQAGKVHAATPVSTLQVLDHQRDQWSHLHVDGQPAQPRHEQGRPGPQQEVAPHRVLDEQEAVHAEPDHEEDGGVEIDVQDVAVDDTSVRTGFRLVVCIEVGEAWQRAEENEVGHRQVEEVNVAALPDWQAKYIAEHDQEVARETDAELNCIEWGQIIPLQPVNQQGAIQCLEKRAQRRK